MGTAVVAMISVETSGVRVTTNALGLNGLMRRRLKIRITRTTYQKCADVYTLICSVSRKKSDVLDRGWSICRERCRIDSGVVRIHEGSRKMCLGAGDRG
jgi:hypothetical protein